MLFKLIPLVSSFTNHKVVMDLELLILNCNVSIVCFYFVGSSIA